MRKFFSFRSSYSSGNDKLAPSELNKSRKKVSSRATEEINSKTSTQERILDGFQTPEDCVLKPRNQNLEDDSSSNPYLRRSLSLTSAAICNHLNEGSFSSSSDQSRMTSCRDNDQHVGRYPLNSHGSFTPDRYGRAGRENLVFNAIEKPRSPGSFGVHQNSSDSNSACSTPIPLKCRTTRTSKISSQNNVLDLYIDGEHKITKVKKDSKKCASETEEDGNLVESNKIPTIGRPPRALCTAPMSPHYNIENHRSYSFREIRDKRPDLSSREWTSDDLNPAFQHKYLGKNIESTCALLGKSITGNLERDFRINAPVEDISENSSDGNPDGTAQGCSFDLILLDKKFNGNLLYEPFDHKTVCFSRIGAKTSERDELINSNLQEHGSNEDLLKKLKDLEERCDLLTEEDPESEKLSFGELLQKVMKIKEDRKHLTIELSSQIRSRLAERSFVNERLKQSKLELNTRTRRLESEKNELKLSLENELDRRSNEWSLNRSKFQAEEQRLRERVRELAEQNVSLQRENFSFQGSELEIRNSVVNIERQLNESRASQDELKAENLNLRQELLELQERCNVAEEQRDHVKMSSKEIERENMELQKLLGRLQRTCNEQDKTISGLRQSYSTDLEKKFLEGDADVIQLQTEKMRLTGVEQKLRRELECCRIETESLRHENIRLLNRLQGTENRYGLSLVRLNVELHAWLECLKKQSLSLLDESSHFCGQLLDFISCRRSENRENANCDTDKYCVVDLTYKHQNLTRAIGSFRRSLKVVSTTFEEKSSIQASKCVCQNAEINSSKHQKGHGSEDDMEVELKAEAILTRLLREKICSRELEIEQLQRDLTSSIRKCDQLSTDIQTLKDEVSCLNHKKRDIEIKMQKKDENFLLLQQDLQQCTRDLTATRSNLTNVSEERDHIWEEMKQLRENNTIMDCELKSLNKKIELLDEDILYKEGQISILKDSLDRKAFDIICSPDTMKKLNMQ
ncbi:hypothetical protein KFK09_021456 [Dendrobium nobile]|uniref:DUF7653 domain-containing protein n=1 Tax=Dendrobium nobile TaxID=94219 RepID=A0A8T3AVW3_DENNO|nr:hypothetical protein KFK09_021456 [Dendrobium nobile]